MSDLVERLRKGFANSICDEAAAELDRITAALAEAEKKGFEKAKQQAAEMARASSENERQRKMQTDCDDYEAELDRAAFGRGEFIMKNFAAAILAMEPKP